MRQVLTLKEIQVKFIDYTACNIKRLEAIHINSRRFGHPVRQDNLDEDKGESTYRPHFIAGGGVPFILFKTNLSTNK
jgi:hypothetical protein